MGISTWRTAPPACPAFASVSPTCARVAAASETRSGCALTSLMTSRVSGGQQAESSGQAVDSQDSVCRESSACWVVGYAVDTELLKNAEPCKKSISRENKFLLEKPIHH